MSRNLPSDENRGHGRLQELTVHRDRDAQAVAKEVGGKEAESLEELLVLSQGTRLDRKCEPNQKVLQVMLRILDFVPAQWFQARR